jgi:hypothetical protein
MRVWVTVGKRRTYSTNILAIYEMMGSLFAIHIFSSLLVIFIKQWRVLLFDGGPFSVLL